MMRQTKSRKDEIMKNVPLTVIYQKIKYDAPGTILQERKWYQLCSCVSKNFPFVNTVGKFPTVTYIARDNPNSGSFSRTPKGKYLEKLQLTLILLEHPATKDGIFNFLCQNSLKIDLFQPVSIFDANVKWICSLSGTSNQLIFLPMRRTLWELNYTFTTHFCSLRTHWNVQISLNFPFTL